MRLETPVRGGLTCNFSEDQASPKTGKTNSKEKRYNSKDMKNMDYSPIARLHDGIKAWVMETGLQLQRLEHSDEGRLQHFLSGLYKLIRVEEGVSQAEEQFLFPVLMDSAPYLVCQFEKDHGQLAVLRQSLCDAAVACSLAVEADEAMMQLQLAFASYMAFLLQHGLRETVVIRGVWSLTVDGDRSRAIGRDILLSLTREQRAHLVLMICGVVHGESRRLLRSELREMGPEMTEGLNPVTAYPEKQVRMTVAA